MDQTAHGRAHDILHWNVRGIHHHTERQMKKKANFPKFAAFFHRVCREVGQDGHLVTRYARRQYLMLKVGVRDVRISDLGCQAWTWAGGEW